MDTNVSKNGDCVVITNNY